MGYWKTKVLPTIKKVFENKNSVKKAAAAEACKSFDESKVSDSFFFVRINMLVTWINIYFHVK